MDDHEEAEARLRLGVSLLLLLLVVEQQRFFAKRRAFDTNLFELFPDGASVLALRAWRADGGWASVSAIPLPLDLDVEGVLKRQKSVVSRSVIKNIFKTITSSKLIPRTSDSAVFENIGGVF